MKKPLKTKRPVFQSVMTPELMRRFDKIAQYKGQERSTLFRNWVDATYARLPKEAQ